MGNIKKRKGQILGAVVGGGIALVAFHYSNTLMLDIIISVLPWVGAVMGDKYIDKKAE